MPDPGFMFNAILHIIRRTILASGFGGAAFLVNIAHPDATGSNAEILYDHLPRGSASGFGNCTGQLL